MNAPVLIFGATAVLSGVSLILRRRHWHAFMVAAAGSLVVGMFALYAPIDSPQTVLGFPIKLERAWQILGRAIILTERNRAPVAFLYLTGALFFACGWVARPGRSFAPIGLLTLGLLAGSLTIEPFLYAAIFLELAAMASILVLNPPGSRGQPGALQLLVLYTLAMMGILFTGWLLENVGVTSVTPDLARRVMTLLALGFSILMFVPPFQFWLGSAAARTNPYSLSFVALILQSSGLFFLLRFLDSFEWLRTEPSVFGAASVLGLLMVGLGAIACVAQADYSRMSAYALIADFGVTLLAVGSNQAIAIEIVLALASVRAVSLAVWGLGTAVMRRIAGSQDLQGAGRVVPVAGAASLIGVVSLAGFPLSAGFPARWALLQGSLGFGGAGALVILVAMLSITLTAAAWAIRLFSPGTIAIESGVTRSDRAILLAAAGISLVLGILPQLALPWVRPAVEGFSNLHP